MTRASTPRLSVVLTEEQFNALQKINLPWGWQRAIFSSIVDDIISIHDKHGIDAIALIVANKVKPREVLSTLKVKDHG
ncbi:hypothetical protein [Desulfofustis phage LS06-2018-MD01]|jgi:hypothetical protein|nr:hypothetical protein [Desulfofustis phage LS06-2018-MD01]